MFLFFEDFQSQSVLIFFLFCMKHSCLSIPKITIKYKVWGVKFVYIDYITKDDFDDVWVILLYENFGKEIWINVILIFCFWTSEPQNALNLFLFITYFSLFVLKKFVLI